MYLVKHEKGLQLLVWCWITQIQARIEEPSHYRQSRGVLAGLLAEEDDGQTPTEGS